LLVEKVRDIVGLYLDPPAHAAVFCVDEKPQIQALDRTQPLLPMQPGASRAPDARLHAARHDDLVRRAQCEDQRSDHAVSSTTPLRAVPRISRSD
jgi:hypothetical protein